MIKQVILIKKMEGKTVVLSVLILSLVMTQTQVKAKICCPDVVERDIFISLHRQGFADSDLLQITGCKDVSGSSCPPGFPYDTLLNSGNNVKGYCKLGCTSSMCVAMTTLLNSDAPREIVNDAVDQCAKACATICDKDSLKFATHTA